MKEKLNKKKQHIYIFHDKDEPNGEYVLYQEGEGCQGLPCKHKLCIPRFVRSFHKQNYICILLDMSTTTTIKVNMAKYRDTLTL